MINFQLGSSLILSDPVLPGQSTKVPLSFYNLELLTFSQACFDVREASAFWAQMQMHDKSLPGAPKIEEWMSTHPSHENRRAILDSKMDEAIRVRDQHQVSYIFPCFLTLKQEHDRCQGVHQVEKLRKIWREKS